MVVADAGPLIAFGHLKGFDLFPDVLGRVLVPEQVLAECLRNPARPDALHIQSAIDKRWLTVERCDSDFLESLPPSLGEGECAAITLAMRQGCPVLMDDKLARRAAKLVGLKVVGTAGVLLKAKQIGRLSQVEPSLKILQSRGYHLSPVLIEEVLSLAGEK
ncbi:MAG: DUF3368 domain-containing protein [Gammaproteobacteria bacterium]